MMINGRNIRDALVAELKTELARRSAPLSLALFLPESPDFATTSFVTIKKKVAKELGVGIAEHTLTREMTTDDVVAEMACVAKDTDGIIVQFPTSAHLDAERIRNAIPLSHDVDGVSDAAIAALEEGVAIILPPVVGAIREICEQEHIDVGGKQVVIVGSGRLVGQPAAAWFKTHGAEVTVIGRDTPDYAAIARADILVLGAGVPGLITPSMIRNGVVLFDAGTSEAEGKLAGDADPACAEKCALFTPVPGGIGPITVAMIFRNLVALAERT